MKDTCAYVYVLCAYLSVCIQKLEVVISVQNLRDLYFIFASQNFSKFACQVFYFRIEDVIKEYSAFIGAIIIHLTIININ